MGQSADLPNLDDLIQVNWNHRMPGTVRDDLFSQGDDEDLLCRCLLVTAVGVVQCISCEVAVSYRALGLVLWQFILPYLEQIYIWGVTNTSYISKCFVEKSIFIFTYHSVTVNHSHCSITWGWAIFMCWISNHWAQVKLPGGAWSEVTNSPERQHKMRQSENPAVLEPCSCEKKRCIQPSRQRVIEVPPHSPSRPCHCVLAPISSPQSLSCAQELTSALGLLVLPSTSAIAPVRTDPADGPGASGQPWYAPILGTWRYRAVPCGWGQQKHRGSGVEAWETHRLAQGPTYAMSLFVSSFDNPCVPRDTPQLTTLVGNLILGIPCRAQLCHWVWTFR